MSKLLRTSFSLEEPLLEQLELLVKKRGYQNRSEFIRDLIRDQLVESEWASDAEVVGTVTIIYDHHKRELSEKLTGLQHEHHQLVLAATHIHLSHHKCAEMIMLRGKAKDAMALADALRQQKGVLSAGLVMSSTGDQLK